MNGPSEERVDIDAYRMPRDPRCVNPGHPQAAHPMTSQCAAADAVDTRAALVSPHGFDGAGPVPVEVVTAAKRLAQLRVKFVHQWSPGCDSPLTTREIEDLFDASALQAEWMRELHEAVHAVDTRDARIASLEAEVERLRKIAQHTVRLIDAWHDGDVTTQHWISLADDLRAEAAALTPTTDTEEGEAPTD